MRKKSGGWYQIAKRRRFKEGVWLFHTVKAPSEMTEELSLAIQRLWEILTREVSVQR